MSTILRSAVSGLLAQKYNLDLIANNIANLNTTGYKKSRGIFADATYETQAAIALPESEPVPEVRAGTGVRVVAAQRVFSPGSFKETDNIWDLAIAGDGFFQVAFPDGQKGYTRDGSFQIDSQGRVATVQGFLLDPPVTIPPGAESIEIDESGVVRGRLNGKPAEFGTISIAEFPNREGLLALGHNLFAPSEASGDAQAEGEAVYGRSRIMSGVQETSNVDLAEEMTKAMEAQRAYQLSIKVLQTADEMLGLANNLRR